MAASNPRKSGRVDMYELESRPRPSARLEGLVIEDASPGPPARADRIVGTLGKRMIGEG
jgi:hypothetical protein